MILDLKHKKLKVYTVADELLVECYKIVSCFPYEERNNLTSQIKRAALSIKLNIAEGSSRKSSIERKRFYEVARGSAIEIDAAIEIAAKLNYLKIENLKILSPILKLCFSMLSKMILIQNEQK